MPPGRTVGLTAGGDTADQLAARGHNLVLVTVQLRSHGARSRAGDPADTTLNQGAGGVRVGLSTLGFAAAMRGSAVHAVLNDPTPAPQGSTPFTQQETR